MNSEAFAFRLSVEDSKYLQYLATKKNNTSSKYVRRLVLRHLRTMKRRSAITQKESYEGY